MGTFSFMYLIYGLTALFGFLLYGSQTDILISANMIEYPGGWLTGLTALVVILNCYTSVGPILSVLAEWPEENLKWQNFPWRQRAFRTFIFAGITVAAYLVINYLAFLE